MCVRSSTDRSLNYIRIYRSTRLETHDENHGRIETRRYWTTDQVDAFAEGTAWKGLGLFGMHRSPATSAIKSLWNDGYYISSLDNDAQRFW